MSFLGKVRVGRKAPYFECEAVVSGAIHDVSLSTYIHPSIKPSTSDQDAPWLIVMFIPAAFSFVCPTEVIAFQNCLHEFKNRNCSIVFVSVDTKHVLWHWQNVPRQFGGLGRVDIPLLSDANHRIAEDYGVLIEEDGVSLRGMFIIDGEGIVQQVTLNNLTVGRSVLEALRLLEAFQAVAKHGVLCPVDWKPTASDQDNVDDTINAIHNTLTESYEERLANLQKEFGGVEIRDFDAPNSEEVTSLSLPNQGNEGIITAVNSPNITPRPSQSNTSASAVPNIEEVVCKRPGLPSVDQNSSPKHDCLSHSSPTDRPAITETPPSPSPLLTKTSSDVSSKSVRSSSAPPSGDVSPLPTLATQARRPAPGSRRQSRGRQTDLHLDMIRLFSSNQIHDRRGTFPTDSSSEHSSAPSTPIVRSHSGSVEAVPAQLDAPENLNYAPQDEIHNVLEFGNAMHPPTSDSHGLDPFTGIDHRNIMSGHIRSRSYEQHNHSQQSSRTSKFSHDLTHRAASQPILPTQHREKRFSSDPPSGAGSPPSQHAKMKATFGASKTMSTEMGGLVTKSRHTNRV